MDYVGLVTINIYIYIHTNDYIHMYIEQHNLYDKDNS